MSPPRRSIMFHGTSSTRLAAILEAGLVLPPEDADGVRHATPDHEQHLRSLIGVYLAASETTAESYATTAADKTGGEAVLVTVLVDHADTVPDEDVVLEFLGNCITDLEAADGSGRHFLDRWRDDESLRTSTADFMASSLRHWIEPEVVGDDEAAFKEFLEFAFAPMAHADFDRCHEAVGQTLWPHFLECALAEPDGVARYRRLMDRVCQCHRAPTPYDDEEYHTVRVPQAVGMEGRSRIVGIGSFDDPFAHFARIDGEVADLLAEAGLDAPQVAAGP